MCALGDEVARHKIIPQYGLFASLLDHVEGYVQRRRYDTAAVYAQIAANYAMCKHTGLFVSPRLERLLHTIGCAEGALPSSTPHRLEDGPPRHILHVLTRAFGVGGDSRMVWRWIEQDRGRTHSVVLTRQGGVPVPEQLRQATAAAQGDVYILNECHGGLRSWARHLRAIAARADLVALHIHPYDCIPSLAFANKQHVPPVVYINHADHVFWIGAGVADVVVSLRASGQHLACTRRGVAPERCALLPIGLPPISRTFSRAQAKQQLGLDPQSVVLLTIARPHKYQVVAGLSYAEALLPVLKQHPEALLLAIGPEPEGLWASASTQTNGRVRALGPREDTALFYQAADVYLDSFPIASVTSLLEAGSYGTPLVSRQVHNATESVHCADAPGLMPHLFRSDSLAAYQAVVAQLIVDPALRERVGQEVQRAIAAVHSGPGWMQALETLYEQIMVMPPQPCPPAGSDHPWVGEVDVLLPQLFAAEPDIEQILQFHLRLLPLELRLPLWGRQVRARQHGHVGLLLPEWLGTTLEKWRPAALG